MTYCLSRHKEFTDRGIVYKRYWVEVIERGRLVDMSSGKSFTHALMKLRYKKIHNWTFDTMPWNQGTYWL